MKRILLFIVGSLFLSSSPAALARNIILFVGDGMGFEHVEAGRLYVFGSSGGGLSFEALAYHGQAITPLPNGAVTDSATAGTALATGYQHSMNGIISMDAQGIPVPTILERAKVLGQRVGIVTTDDIGGATPGAFGAHEPDRNLLDAIRYDYLLDDVDHPASLPNVLLGGGANTTYASTASSLGYTVVWSDSELAGLDLLGGGAPGWLLGQFATGSFTRENDRLPGNTEPRLATMVQRSLELLSREGTPFFLMVESALIDKLSHDNSRDDLCPEMAQFHLAVQAALEWVSRTGGFTETLVVVTADHETGGLIVPDGQTIQPGEVPLMSFSSTGHTAADVPVYASWPATLQGARIDNTEIYFLLEDWMTGAQGLPPQITGLTVENVKQDAAVIRWPTREPATGLVECYVGTTLAATGADPARATTHLFPLSGLVPDTEYFVQVGSQDLAGYLGTASLTFRTATPDADAYVVDEPKVVLGSVTGTLSGLAMPGDGLTQVITETPIGTGSGLDIVYTLHTSAEVSTLMELTLNIAFTWSDRDRSGDGLEAAVYNVLNNRWDILDLLPGTGILLSFPQAYVDDTGNLMVRFVDTGRFTREKKDLLTLDWLQGDVVAGPPDREAPAAPTQFSVAAPLDTELTALLSWVPGADPVTEPDLAGYYVQRSGTTEMMFTVEPTWTDRVMVAGTYAYQVAAVDFSGNLSSWTDPIGVTLANEAPSAPTGLIAQPGDRSVILQWNPNPEWDVVGYNIYQGQENGEWRLLDDGVTQTTYQISNLDNGSEYPFAVAAVDSETPGLTAQVIVTPSAIPKVWVGAIEMSLTNAGKNWKATSTTRVLTAQGGAVGATLSGQWLLDGQVMGSAVTGTVDSLGQVILTSSPIKATSGTFTFRVNQVTLAGHEFESVGHPTEALIRISP